MSRRTKIIIGAILAILLLLLLAFLFLLPREGSITEGVNDVFGNQPQTGGLINSTTGTAVGRGTDQPAANVNAEPPPPPPADERSNLRRIAAAFAERFGSFSNQSDYENIFELKVLMTARMQAWADAYVEQQRRDKQASAVYFGVTTRSISTELLEFDEELGTASVKVSTQRSEESGETLQRKVYYQELILDFIREGEIWKVDAAIWQPV